jgi:hypothetical protein
MDAAAFGHAAAVEALIQAGADVNLKNKAGVGALQRANLGKHPAVIRLLEEAGATVEADK